MHSNIYINFLTQLFSIGLYNMSYLRKTMKYVKI